MNQYFEPVKTEVGIISGRDAIFLDNVKFDYKSNSIILSGELNSNLCSNKKHRSEFIIYSLTFSGVLGFKMVELDFGDSNGKSSFDLVQNSIWLAEMQRLDSASKVTPQHKHYFIQTYDDIFEIVSLEYELTIGMV